MLKPALLIALFNCSWAAHAQCPPTGESLVSLQALYVSVQEIGNDEVKAALLPGLRKAIKDVG